MCLMSSRLIPERPRKLVLADKGLQLANTQTVCTMDGQMNNSDLFVS